MEKYQHSFGKWKLIITNLSRCFKEIDKFAGVKQLSDRTYQILAKQVLNKTKISGNTPRENALSEGAWIVIAC